MKPILHTNPSYIGQKAIWIGFIFQCCIYKSFCLILLLLMFLYSMIHISCCGSIGKESGLADLVVLSCPVLSVTKRDTSATFSPVVSLDCCSFTSTSGIGSVKGELGVCIATLRSVITSIFLPSFYLFLGSLRLFGT